MNVNNVRPMNVKVNNVRPVNSRIVYDVDMDNANVYDIRTDEDRNRIIGAVPNIEDIRVDRIEIPHENNPQKIMSIIQTSEMMETKTPLNRRNRRYAKKMKEKRKRNERMEKRGYQKVSKATRQNILRLYNIHGLSQSVEWYCAQCGVNATRMRSFLLDLKKGKDITQVLKRGRKKIYFSNVENEKIVNIY